MTYQREAIDAALLKALAPITAYEIEAPAAEALAPQIDGLLRAIDHLDAIIGSEASPSFSYDPKFERGKK